MQIDTMNRFELFPGERIVVKTPKHWRNYIPPVFAILLCLVALFLRLRYPDVSLLSVLLPGSLPPAFLALAGRVEILLLAVLLPVLAFGMVETAYTQYYITDRRIAAVSGFLNVRVSELMLDRCESVTLSQRLGERLFNAGDILCVSAGAAIYLDDVYDAMRFKQTLMELISGEKSGDGEDGTED